MILLPLPPKSWDFRHASTIKFFHARSKVIDFENAEVHFSAPKKRMIHLGAIQTDIVHLENDMLMGLSPGQI
jgi:aminopeptidase-like protein